MTTVGAADADRDANRVADTELRGAPGVTARRSTGWPAGLARATAATRLDPGLWAVALVGFLVRGGLAVLVVPIVALPSAVGVANLVGPTAVTASGLTVGTVVTLATMGVPLLLWLVASTAVGAITDALVVGSFGGIDERESRLSWARFGRLFAIRLAALVPLSLAVAAAARPIFDVVYAQLLTPSDIATSFAFRALRAATGPVAIVIAAWILGEVVGGIAVRRSILRDEPVARSLVGAAVHVARRPVSTFATTAVSIAALTVALAPGIWASGVAWTTVHDLVARRAMPAAIAVAVVLLVAAWLGGLGLVAIASGWRGHLWTAEVSRSGRS